MSFPNDIIRDVIHPLDVILDGNNYALWASNMILFLKRRNSWRYIFGDYSKPVRAKDESTVDCTTCLDDWKSIYCKILQWIINTLISSINSLIPKLKNAKVA